MKAINLSKLKQGNLISVIKPDAFITGCVDIVANDNIKFKGTVVKFKLRDGKVDIHSRTVRGKDLVINTADAIDLIIK